MPESMTLVRRVRRRGIVAVGAVLGAAALALAPAAANAHDYLVDTSPASGATQSQPLTQVSLTFNDRVLDLAGDGKSAILQVTSGGRYYETGCPTILDRAVSAPVTLGAAGAYIVDWQIVSADGHTVSGTYGFEYAPASGAAAASNGSATPTCGAPATPGVVATPGAAAPTPGETASTSAPVTTPSSTDSGLPLVIGIGVGIVVLALIGVVIVVVTARRKPPSTPSAPTPEDPS